jgi:hypothetical protein
MDPDYGQGRELPYPVRRNTMGPAWSRWLTEPQAITCRACLSPRSSHSVSALGQYKP